MRKGEALRDHGVAGILKHGEKILLLREARAVWGEHQGAWEPPHGRCELADGNEATTIIREFAEETGLAVRVAHKILECAPSGRGKTMSFFLVEPVGEMGEIVLEEAEASAYGWFTVGEALALKLFPATRAFFERAILKESV